MEDLQDSEKYNYIFKIILIGNSGVGKSSILKRYIQKVFEDNYSCTIGVDFFMKSITIGDKTIKLQLWDTAGTEKFRSITTGYYRGANAALVVFDLTSKQSFASLNEWIQNYYKFSNPDSVKNVVILGNKSDLTEKREVTDEEINDFIKDNNIKFFETSAKDGKNIDECFTHMSEKLIEQYDNKENELVKRKDLITNDNLKNNTVDISGEGKCCF